ncbi:hypothetical protein BC937DRAFT_88647 [Endogone sp. FLAS-F59071]|nr:hypothetical protein BC937DRAFT_88647 [Endogone sp. FLAS-F59071]|eukprot:RUS18535.1 hypothetical protein BC937DRAFT_88647 [Endogone sp. FLAS-F59071]
MPTPSSLLHTMHRLSTLVALIVLALSVAAQVSIDHRPATIASEAASSQFSILGTVTAYSIDPSNTQNSSTYVASVSVLCSYTGQVITSPSITVHGFETSKEVYCLANTTVGFTGIFFLNATLLHAAPPTNTSQDDFQLADYCTSPFPATSANIAALLNVKGAAAHGTQCSAPSSSAVTATMTNTGSSSPTVSGSPSSTASAAEGMLIGGNALWYIMIVVGAATAALA